MVICLGRDADLHMAHLMPVPLTVSCFSRPKIQMGLVPVLAYPDSPGQSPDGRKTFSICCTVKTFYSMLPILVFVLLP